jgi:hypothetical protein
MGTFQMVVLFAFTWLALAQEAPPKCKTVKYWGVTGCDLSAEGTCAKGYHRQLACPTNPMIKAPCRALCVADRPKADLKKKDDAKKPGEASDRQ